MSTSQNFPTITPSLSLDFANVQALDPRITYTRASTATYYGTETAKAEENLFVHSQEFDNAVWNKVRATVTANTTAAPDGTSTAETMTATAGTNAAPPYVYLPVTGTASVNYVISFFAKAGTHSFIQLVNPTGTAWHCNFNLTAGSGAVGTSNNCTGSIVDAGNDWYRCVVVYTPSTTVVSTVLAMVASDSANNFANWSPVGTETILLWGAQLEQRSAVTAYTPTTTQPITNYIPVLESAASGVARFDHNPTTFESLGFLVEEQRTNLLLRSEEFDNAYWTKTRSSITANTIVAPDGTLTGDKLVEDTTSSNTHNIDSTNVSFTSGTTYTYSLYAKAAERSRIWLVGNDNNRFPGSAYFDLSTGTVVQQTTGTATITSVGNGWYRCTYTTTSNQTGNTAVAVYLVSSGTTTAYTGDGYSGIYIFGAQLEAGAFATSYVKTVASQVTRAADSASMTGTNFSSFYNQAEGTVYVEATAPEVTSNARGIYAISDGTTSNRIQSIFANELHLVVSANGTVQASIDAGSLTANQSSKLAATVKRDDMAAVLNGGSVATDSSALMPVVDRLFFGSGSTGTPSLCGTIRKISYYPIRLTNAQLQALTS